MYTVPKRLGSVLESLQKSDGRREEEADSFVFRSCSKASEDLSAVSVP